LPRTSDTAICDSAQHPIARGIVDVEILVGGTGIPTDEVVEQVVGQRGGGAAGGAADDVTPIVVATGVDLPVLFEQVAPLAYRPVNSCGWLLQ